MSEVEIYDGLRRIGYVIERNANRCEAFTAAGTAIGVFTSRAQAARAVYEAAHDEQRGAAA